MILGLDISTSITGVTILDKNGNVLLNEAINLTSKNIETFLQKAKIVKDRLNQLKALYNIEKIYIEQSLSAFRPGLSSAQVILTLGKFNGIISWICYELFGIEPEYLGASSARKSLGIKVERGENAKEVVLAHLLKILPSFTVEYTLKGNPKSGTYDRADSYVIAYAGFLQQNK
jgi:Holliday junction resolvasome RuvABC endonuclease subunit